MNPDFQRVTITQIIPFYTEGRCGVQASFVPFCVLLVVSLILVHSSRSDWAIIFLLILFILKLIHCTGL